MPESAPPGGPRTAGLRAARAYARIEQSEIATRLGMSIRDYRRVEAGEKQLDSDQRNLVAEMCCVPYWLVHDGLSMSVTGGGTVTDRLTRLEALATQNAEGEEELRRLTGRVLILEEEAGQRTASLAHTSEDRHP